VEEDLVSYAYGPYAGRPSYAPPSRPRAGSRRCCCGCAAAVFGLSLLFFGVALGLALSRPRVDPGVRERLTRAENRWQEPVSDTSRATARRVTERAESVRRHVAEDASAGQMTPFEITVSEDEVNAILTSNDEVRRVLGEQGVRGATILFEEGKILLSGQADRAGLTFDVTAEAVPIVRADGTLDVRVENARAGNFPLPSSIVEEARSALREAISKQDPERGRIGEVQLTRGRLTVKGRVDSSIAGG
jgi:hypothetical protein